MTFRERKRRAERKRERWRERNTDVRNISWLPPEGAPIRDGTRNLGTCPNRE